MLFAGREVSFRTLLRDMAACGCMSFKSRTSTKSLPSALAWSFRSTETEESASLSGSLRSFR